MVNETLKQTFIDTLRSTGREGVEGMLSFLERSDFYTAPASASYHGNYEGGLLMHSILVLQAALTLKSSYIQFRPDLADIPNESIVISALLHDLCKTGFYVKGNKWKKDPQTGVWSSTEGYDVNDRFPLGHGEKSLVMILNSGMKLTVDEMMAIRWHQGFAEVNGMSVEEKCAYNEAVSRYPLVTIIQLADVSAAFLFEALKK